MVVVYAIGPTRRLPLLVALRFGVIIRSHQAERTGGPVPYSAMTVASRWGSQLFVNWRPILTYARRQLELLDWFEANVDVAAFSDDDAGIGVAVGARAQRLIVTRSGLRIELRGLNADASVLTDALRGVWEVMEPFAPTVWLYQCTTSIPVDRDYGEARTALATRAVGVLAEGAGAVLDCANLVDVRTEGGAVTVEFGIVSAEELEARLATPALGRMEKRTGHSRAAVEVDAAELPPTALYADAYWAPAPRREPLQDSDSVLSALGSTGEEIERLVVGLHRAL